MTGEKLKKRFLLNKTANNGDLSDTVALDSVSNSDIMVTDAINQVPAENSGKELIPPVRFVTIRS